jgi:hypothetical protein
MDENAGEGENDEVALTLPAIKKRRNSSLEIPTVRFKSCTGS